ncbi:NAD-dependent epimerase/dehydratase family protein [Pseudolysinimonas kribbensis]|uniref:UDP-glucose 4-epimerase n=1 Tax=Pseudolysinimonas kribbensis TaxID=433641 RepID=A0ABQ6K0Z4_9MICO|nr:SDR family oxidoreductase [Pseudolysinimonas kribbensis]GMA94272.1 UDP-glucose 4-epimerase [Pseudolysinimonas kribbensis]
MTVRVLVTGADGRIGARLPQTPGVSWIRASHAELDVADRAAWREALTAKRPEVVVQLAGMTSAGTDPGAMRRVNVDAVRLLAEEAARAGAGIVLASSAAVYGDRHERPVDESSALDGVGPYAESKIAAEELLSTAVVRGDLRAAAALRIFNVFGPGMRDSLVNRLQSAVAGPPVPLRGPRGFVRDYVHVDDVGEALARAARGLEPGWLPVNVGRGIPVDNQDLAGSLGLTEGVAFVWADGPPSFSCAVVDRAAAVFGVRPARGPTAVGGTL